MDNFNKCSQPMPLAFAVDVDGTLVTEGKAIEGAAQGLNYLSQLGIPYVLVTNNISASEKAKAKELNQILNLSEPITVEQVILNYTPLKNFMRWSDFIILIIGREKALQKVLPFPEIPYYITIQEYCAIFSERLALSCRHSNQNSKQVEARIGTRLQTYWEKYQLPQTLSAKSLQFGAVFILNFPHHWEQSYQVIIDHLSTTDGRISDKLYYQPMEEHIPVISALNDLCLRVQDCKLPRFLLKPFNQGLKAIYQLIYGRELKLHTYGKPELKTFEYIKEHLRKNYGEIKRICIIGDNEGTDIQGAANAQWDSILVKTGVTRIDSQIATVNAKCLLEGIIKYLNKINH